MPEHQVGSAGTDAVARGALAGGLDQRRMSGEPEIVVAAKRDVVNTIHAHAGALRGLQQTPASSQPSRVEVRQFCRECLLE